MNTPWDEHPLNSSPAATPAARLEPDRAAGMPAKASGLYAENTGELEKKLGAMIEEVLSSRRGEWLSTLDESQAQYEELVFPKHQEH